MARKKTLGAHWAMMAAEGKIARAPEPELTDREMAIRDRMSERSQHSMAEMVAEYNTLEDDADAARQLEKLRDQKFEALSRLMCKWLEGNGTELYRAGGFTFKADATAFPNVKDKDAVVKWLRDTGQEDRLSLPSLRDDVKDALGPEGSGELPPGVEVFIKTTIKRTK